MQLQPGRPLPLPTLCSLFFPLLLSLGCHPLPDWILPPIACLRPYLTYSSERWDPRLVLICAYLSAVPVQYHHWQQQERERPTTDAPSVLTKADLSSDLSYRLCHTLFAYCSCTLSYRYLLTRSYLSGSNNTSIDFIVALRVHCTSFLTMLCLLSG